MKMKHEPDFENELKDGQKCAAELIAMVGGIGAGGLVGGTLLALANTLHVGKVWKVVYQLGSFGVGWYVDHVVEDEMDTNIKEMLVAYNRIKGAIKVRIKAKKDKEVPAEVDEANT